MKVLIVQEHVDAGRGGAETATLEMARHLAALGLDVHLACAAGADPAAAPALTWHPIPAAGATRALRTYRYLQGVQRLRATARFDVVHAVVPSLTATVYQPRGGTYVETVARTLARVRAPILRELKRLGRRFNVRQRFLARLERRLLTHYVGRVTVAAVSHYVRRQIEVQYGVPTQRIRVVFNGVDFTPLPPHEAAATRAALRARLGLDERTPVLLFVAHNFALKGLRELLSALPRVPGTLVVAGRDRPRRYAARAARLGVAQRVRFVGVETPVRDWYAAADVLAHPTWYDPCSRVVLEALSAGLPVVTTRYNGAAEVVQPTGCGRVVAEPADTPALAAALHEALTPEVRRTCAAAAPELRQSLSMARHARELLALYQDLRQGRAPPRPPP